MASEDVLMGMPPNTSSSTHSNREDSMYISAGTSLSALKNSVRSRMAPAWNMRSHVSQPLCTKSRVTPPAWAVMNFSYTPRQPPA